MLIIAAGMSRSASTWCYQVASELVQSRCGGNVLGYVTEEQFDQALIDKVSGPGLWVLKSHASHPRMLELAHAGQAKVIYSYRDVRDVVYSLAHKIHWAPRDIILHQLPHQFRWQKEWTACPEKVVIRYESHIAGTHRTIDQIARLLGMELLPLEIARLDRQFSFDRNRFRCQLKKQELESKGCDLSDPKYVHLFEHEQLLHWNHMRRGTPGQWRDVATQEELDLLAEVAGDWLFEHGYAVDCGWSFHKHLRCAG
jgi:hypothetical protein